MQHPTLLDKKMAKIVERELEANGVKTILGERVEEIVGKDGNVKGIKTNTKREIDSDFIVLGTGVRPNSEIARDAGVELGSANAIKVDEYMKTDIPDVFSVGDCAVLETISQIKTCICLWVQQLINKEELQEKMQLVETQSSEE